MKISDFRLAEYFLRKFCSSYNLNFVDVSLEFTDDLDTFVHNGCLYVGESESFGRTLFHIVGTYLSHIEAITESNRFISDKDKTSFITSFVSLIRDMTYDSNSFHPNKLEGETYLNRQPLVYVLLRDIVCPAFDIPVENIKIKAIKSPYIDGAKWLTKENVNASNYADFPIIMLNLDIENKAYLQAFLFVEAIKAHGLEPSSIVHTIFTKDELRNPFFGLLKISLIEDNAINNFLTIVSALTGYKSELPIAVQASGGKVIKTAIGQTWWYLGLIEKLLEPARGPDWEIYKELENANEELWNKIEAEKQKRGLDPLPLELLLRVQSEEYKQNPELTIQGLLADNRVW